MKPQERVAAIVKSDVGPLEKCVLFVLASHMSDTNLSCFVRPETVAVETRMAPSTVKGILRDLCMLGVLTREDDGHRSKVTRIEWDALAAYRNPKENPALLVARKQEPKRKGGKDGAGDPSDNRSEVSGNRTAPSVLRTPESVLRTPDNDEEESVLRTVGSVLRTAPSVILTAGVRIADAKGPYCGPDPDLIRIYDPSTPPTPSFDSTTVADPTVNEEEEDNSQQNPEDSCTQQPKSMIEPEQTMDPNDYNHDEDIDAEIAAFLEEQKRIAKQNEQGMGVEPSKDPLENVGRYLTDPDYAPSLWKNLADRMPKEKVRDIVPLEQLPPDPELDAMLAEQWKSRVTDDTIGPLPSVRDTMREIAQGTAQTTPPPAPVARPVAPVAPQGANLPRWLRQGPKVAVAPAPVAVKPQLPKVPGELMVLFTSPTKEGEMGMTPSDAQRLIVALVQNEIRTSDVLFSRSRSELKMMRGVSAYNERIEAYLQRAHGIGLAPDYRNRWDVIVSSLARHDDMNHLSDNERSAIGAMGLTWPRMKAMSTFELSRKAESFVDEMRLLPRVQTYGDMYNK